MNAEEWSAAANCIAALVTVISAGLIVWQLAEMKRGQQSQAVALIYDSFIELDKFFLTHPELRPYVYEQKEIAEMSSELSMLCEPLAEMVVDILYKAFNQNLVLDPKGFEAEICYMRSLFSSPLMNDFLQKRRHWYREEFSNAMLIHEADNASPPRKRKFLSLINRLHS